MKKSEILFLLITVITALFVSACSKDEDDSSVVVNDNGTTSNGSIFSVIDNNNFYLDYVKYTIEEGHLVVSGYDRDGLSGVVKIVSSITFKGNTYEVLSIRGYVFSNCSNITNVTIGNNVKTIGSHAFAGCSKLKTILFPNSITSVGEYAFDGTEWYNNLSEGLIYVGRTVYSYKGTIPNNTKIKLKDDIVGITAYAFNNCSGLASIEIPNSVKSIGYSAFEFCI